MVHAHEVAGSTPAPATESTELIPSSLPAEAGKSGASLDDTADGQINSAIQRSGLATPSRAPLPTPVPPQGTAAAGLNGINSAILDERATARAELLYAMADYRRENHLGKIAGAYQFCEAYNLGQIPVSAMAREMIPTVGGPTLLRWLKHRAAGGIKRLSGEYGKRKGSGHIDQNPDLREWIVAYELRHAAKPVGAPMILKAMRAEFGDRAPSLGQIRRFARAFRRDYKVEIAFATNPDHARSAYGAAFGRASEEATEYLQIVELDGSPTDIRTLSGRRQLIIMTDVFTRMRWAIVAPSESTDSTGRLICRLLTQVGVPAKIRTDNGAGFTSVRMRAFLEDDLKIHLDPMLPYRGDLKPFVESSVRYAQRMFATLPGYAGRSVAQRDKLRSRLSMAERRGKSEDDILEVSMTDEELEAAIDKWLSQIYANDTHSGLKGRSPNQVLTDWVARGGTVRKVADERALFGLLMEGGERTVGKKGIWVDGALFCAAELGAWIGKQVWIARHYDRGLIVVYSMGGINSADRRFICVATNSDRLGEDRRAIAMAAKAKQRAFIKAVRKEASAMTRSHSAPIGALILASTDGIDSVQVPSTAYETPALEAARVAVAELEAQINPQPAIPHYDADTVERGREVSAQIESRVSAAEAERREDEELWNRFKALRDRMNRMDGINSVTDAERAWMKSYSESNEGRTRLRMEEWFGPRLAAQAE